MSVLVSGSNIVELYKGGEGPKKYSYKPFTLFQVGHFLVMVVTMMMSSVRLINSRTLLLIVWGSILFLVLVLLPAGVIIFFVEMSEKKKKLAEESPVEKVLGVSFQKEWCSIEVSKGSVVMAYMLPRSGIKSISAYTQSGWFWVRDRGFMIECSDGKQLRFILRMNKFERLKFIDELLLSLESIGYSTGKARAFQV
ncbi:hypothetical protein [Pseudomonas sp. LD120]|uniref:hypothetical protein n=1 Tax=Pseudomonas sp. LD120 TaxID=485751 RepID=UPI001359F62F|nr:hypothetical protein [Pseudomonas sp. LD120]KAF0865557.1 hypothetical protein PLD_09820 [Pseudomonas sp. LD120]